MLNFQREIRVRDQVNQMGGIAIEMEMLQRVQRKVHEYFLHQPGEARHKRRCHSFLSFALSYFFFPPSPGSRVGGVASLSIGACD